MIQLWSSHAHHSDLLFLYANVPAISCKTDQLTVSECACDSLEAGKTDKAKWIEHGMQLLMKDEFVKEEYISWAAFHVSLSVPQL